MTDSFDTPSDGKVARVISIVLLIGLILAWAGLALVIAIALALGLDMAGMSPFGSVQIEDGASHMTALFSMLTVFLASVVAIFIITQLRRICGTLISGDPFIPVNSSRLRKIWMALVAFEVSRIVLAAIGARVIYPDIETDDMSTVFRFTVWFLILVLVIFAEMFREGARLRHEQQYTI